MKDDITHRPESQDFVKIIEGKESVLRYKKAPDGRTLDYYITFVPVELRGHHIGEELVKFALDYAEKNHFLVIPSCPFVKKYIVAHPEYHKLEIGRK